MKNIHLDDIWMKFKEENSDYPGFSSIQQITYHPISDSDIPSGSGGINRERYTYGQLRKHPIIPELLKDVSNNQLRKQAENCNQRNINGFTMFKVNGEYCFWGLRVEPAIKAPTATELVEAIQTQNPDFQLSKQTPVTTQMIRKVTYDLLRDKIAETCNITSTEAKYAIGNQLDCAPHEDVSGYLFMVPNWAHYWFRHDGYVAKMLKEINE